MKHKYFFLTNEYLIEVQFEVSPCKLSELKFRSGESRQCAVLFRNVTLLVPPLYLVLRLHQCPPVFSIIVITEQTEDFPRDRWILVLQTPAWCLARDSWRSKLLYLREESPFVYSLLVQRWELPVQPALLLGSGGLRGEQITSASKDPWKCSCSCSRRKWCRVGEIMYDQ